MNIGHRIVIGISFLPFLPATAPWGTLCSLEVASRDRPCLARPWLAVIDPDQFGSREIAAEAADRFSPAP
jgi:hypothetical protein